MSVELSPVEDLLRRLERSPPEQWEEEYSRKALTLTEDDKLRLLKIGGEFKTWFEMRSDVGPPGVPLPSFEESREFILSNPQHATPLHAYTLIFESKPINVEIETIPLMNEILVASLLNSAKVCYDAGASWLGMWALARAILADFILGNVDRAIERSEGFTRDHKDHPQLDKLRVIEPLKHSKIAKNSVLVRITLHQLWPYFRVPLIPNLPNPIPNEDEPEMMKVLDELHDIGAVDLLNLLRSSLTRHVFDGIHQYRDEVLVRQLHACFISGEALPSISELPPWFEDWVKSVYISGNFELSRLGGLLLYQAGSRDSFVSVLIKKAIKSKDLSIFKECLDQHEVRKWIDQIITELNELPAELHDSFVVLQFSQHHKWQEAFQTLMNRYDEIMLIPATAGSLIAFMQKSLSQINTLYSDELSPSSIELIQAAKQLTKRFELSGRHLNDREFERALKELGRYKVDDDQRFKLLRESDKLEPLERLIIFSKMLMDHDSQDDTYREYLTLYCSDFLVENEAHDLGHFHFKILDHAIKSSPEVDLTLILRKAKWFLKRDRFEEGILTLGQAQKYAEERGDTERLIEVLVAISESYQQHPQELSKELKTEILAKVTLCQKAKISIEHALQLKRIKLNLDDNHETPDTISELIHDLINLKRGSPLYITVGIDLVSLLFSVDDQLAMWLADEISTASVDQHRQIAPLYLRIAEEFARREDLDQAKRWAKRAIELSESDLILMSRAKIILLKVELNQGQLDVAQQLIDELNSIRDDLNPDLITALTREHILLMERLYEPSIVRTFLETRLDHVDCHIERMIIRLTIAKYDVILGDRVSEKLTEELITFSLESYGSSVMNDDLYTLIDLSLPSLSEETWSLIVRQSERWSEAQLKLLNQKRTEVLRTGKASQVPSMTEWTQTTKRETESPSESKEEDTLDPRLDEMAEDLCDDAIERADSLEGLKSARLETALTVLKRAYEMCTEGAIKAEISARIAWVSLLYAQSLNDEHTEERLSHTLERFKDLDRKSLSSITLNIMVHQHTYCEALIAIRRGERSAALQIIRSLVTETESQRSASTHYFKVELSTYLLDSPTHLEEVIEGLSLAESVAHQEEEIHPVLVFKAAWALARALNSFYRAAHKVVGAQRAYVFAQLAEKWIERALAASEGLGIGEEICYAHLLKCRLMSHEGSAQHYNRELEHRWDKVRDSAAMMLWDDQYLKMESEVALEIARTLSIKYAEERNASKQGRIEFALSEAEAHSVAKWVIRSQQSSKRELSARLTQPLGINAKTWSQWRESLGNRDEMGLHRTLQEIRAKAPWFLSEDQISEGTWRWLEAQPGGVALSPFFRDDITLVLILRVGQRGTRSINMIGFREEVERFSFEELKYIDHATGLGQKRLKELSSQLRVSLIEPILDFLGSPPSVVLWNPHHELRLMIPSLLWQDIPVALSTTLSITRSSQSRHPRKDALIALADPAESGPSHQDLRGYGIAAVHKLKETWEKAGRVAHLLASVGPRFGEALIGKGRHIINRPMSPVDLLREAKSRELIIIIAHGEVRDLERARLLCLGRDGNKAPLELSHLEENRSSITGATIILLACEGGQVGAASINPGGVAGALISAGALCVVAPLIPIQLKVAERIAEQLLRGFVQGRETWETLSSLDSDTSLRMTPKLGRPSSKRQTLQADLLYQTRSFVSWVG